MHDHIAGVPADAADCVCGAEFTRGNVVRLDCNNSVGRDHPRATDLKLSSAMDGHADHRDIQSDVGRADSVARSRDFGRADRKHFRLEILSVKHGSDLRHGIRINLCRINFVGSTACAASDSIEIGIRHQSR